MAFPGPKEESEREQAFRSLVARALYEETRLERDAAPFLNPRLNRYLEMPESHASKICRKVRKVLDARSEVGRIAAPWILELWTGDYPDLPAMGEAILKERVSNLLGRDADMWIRRAWRPARPAFHLFAAYFVAALILPPELMDPFNPVSLAARAPDNDLTAVIARLAVSFQEKLVADPRFRFKRQDLVWLEWLDDSATNR